MGGGQLRERKKGHGSANNNKGRGGGIDPGISLRRRARANSQKSEKHFKGAVEPSLKQTP